MAIISIAISTRELGMTKEEWVKIEEFPDYIVSDGGRVMNAYSDHIKAYHINQQGIPSVLMSRDKSMSRRSVAVLVANAFLDPPDRYIFDTPINLNGDRLDNRASNLMWRPRWFAIKYHQQMKVGRRMTDRQIMNGSTEIVYSNSFEAAFTLGLLERDIYMSITNNTYPFPTTDRYYFAEESHGIIEGIE